MQGWNDPFPGRSGFGSVGTDDDRVCEVCGEVQFCDDMNWITNLGYVCDNCIAAGFDND